MTYCSGEITAIRCGVLFHVCLRIEPSQLHEQEEVLSMWGPDVPRAGLTAQSALVQLLGAFAGFATLGFVIKNYGVPERPAAPRDFPYDGLVKELGGVVELKVIFCFIMICSYSMECRQTLNVWMRKISIDLL